MLALPDTCNDVVAQSTAGSVTSVEKSIVVGNPVWVPQLILVWPTGAWLTINVPFVTANANGPNSSEKFRSRASTPIQVRPAVEVTCTSCNVPDTPAPGSSADADSVNANPVAPAPNATGSASNWVNENVPSTVNNPTRSMLALPDTCNDVVAQSTAGSVTSVEKSIVVGNPVWVPQLILVWPTGAWLTINVPFVTAIANGPNSSEKFRSRASTPIQVRPAVEVTCTSCNVPDTPAPGSSADADNVNANPVAPAPNATGSASNWVNENVPSTVNNPTRSMLALPDTCNDVVAQSTAGSVTSVEKSIVVGNPVWVPQSILVWPTGAWLTINVPFVTAIANGPNSSEKFRSRASTPIQVRPAVEVTCTSCNVPDTPAPGSAADADNVNANPVAPAPNATGSASNWVNENVPSTVNNPTRSMTGVARHLQRRRRPVDGRVGHVGREIDRVGTRSGAPVDLGLTDRRLVQDQPAIRDRQRERPELEREVQIRASTPSHVRPAVEVTCTNCNVPDTPAPGSTADADNANANPVAPAPNAPGPHRTASTRTSLQRSTTRPDQYWRCPTPATTSSPSRRPGRSRRSRT